MKSKTSSDSEDESNLVIVTSGKSIETITHDISNDDSNNIYSDDVIENLWQSGAMGNDGPEEILVSLWYFVTHYFGIRSRMDHARLCLGNISTEIDGSSRRLVFKRNVVLSGKDSSVFITRFPPQDIIEVVGNKDRCPVAIFGEYVKHRPSNFCYPESPFYLKPDKSVSQDYEGPWYAAAGLGKNRIGSLFNSALSRCGQPTIRHYNSRRQVIGDAAKSQPLISTKSVGSSPKIKLKICHLSSGNPIVTQTLSDESAVELIKPKLRSAVSRMSGTRKRYAEDPVEMKSEPLVNINPELGSNLCLDGLDKGINDNDKDKLDTSMTKYVVKSTKRMGSVQKSIVNITQQESNPIIRQIMMQLCSTKDVLLPSDNKASGGASSKARLLRRGLKLSHLQLPLWPTIDKFCDSDLQRSMRYSFDDDYGHKTDTEQIQ